MIRKFYFNTGVRYDPSYPLMKDQCWINGVKYIEFYCRNVPEDSIFLYASDSIEHVDDSTIMRAEIVSGGLLSKYAYFKLPYEYYRNSR